MDDVLHDLLGRLGKLARQGPIAAEGVGSKAVGMTLLGQLGIRHTSQAKPNFHGIVLSARRGNRWGGGNRVNLFAQVPDWSISACKSSAQILDRCGYYDGGGAKRLYCTVESSRENSQGLFLRVDRSSGLLREMHRTSSTVVDDVASWKLQTLKQRLLQTHPATLWIGAISIQRGGTEHFHYRFATYTGRPKQEVLGDLIEAGAVTVDHLIGASGGRIVEKGPLFKMLPSNMKALFDGFAVYDLMDC